MSDSDDLVPVDPLAERLAALDRLHQQGHISDAELADARRHVLAGGPLELSAAVPVPPALADGDPPRVPSRPVDPPAASPPPESRRAMGTMIVGALVIAIVAVGAFVVFGRGGDGPKDARAASGTDSSYLAEIEPGLDRLTRSAIATGTSLGRTSEPGEIDRLNRSAEQQLGLVEDGRRRLSRVAVADGQRRAHAQLLRAAAAHRRYLIALGRASSGAPSRAALAATGRARRDGAGTVRAYRAFFALAPGASDAITGTDLADVAGLRAAISAGIAAARPAPVPVSAPRVASGPRVYGGVSFQSPTGNLRCQLSGDSLFCSSSNDGFGVVLPSFGAPSSGQSGIAAGGQVVPYGSDWSGGAFTCDSEFDGITCRNSSGNGFFLNRDRYQPF